MYDAAGHFAQLFSKPPRYRFSATTAVDFERWQRDLRDALRSALGLPNIAADCGSEAPRAERTGVVELADHRRESFRLFVEPTVALPFYLLTPKAPASRLPLVLTPHGHQPPHLHVGIANNAEEQRQIEQEQADVALQAVREGYAVISPTTRAFGETRTAEDIAAARLSSCRTELLHALLVGRTVIGERVWDISRLLDWALEHQNIDRRRIAITGSSGGGTTSLFAAACDERISVVVPCAYFSSFAGSIGTIHHCDCNYVPGLLRLGEMAEVAGLVAPRFFCAVVGEADPIFPVEHARREHERLRGIHGVAGAADRLELYVGRGGHRYFGDGAWPFMARAFRELGSA